MDCSPGHAGLSSLAGNANFLQFRPAKLVSAAAVGAVLSPSLAQAAESAPEGFFDIIFYTVDSLGPLGPIAFIVSVALCECVPLFPTQPLSLASGLLFGAQKGAVCMLVGTTLAALIAFTIARGVGRPVAERIIRSEMAHDSKASGEFSAPGVIQAKLQEVQDAIEGGSVWQQAGAVMVLRLTPIVPFSASNYILGLSPLPIIPYLGGTMGGMAFWSAVYSSLGGASRSLLRRGVDPDVLLNDLIQRAGNITETAAVIAAVAGGAVAASYAALALRKRLGTANEDTSAQLHDGSAENMMDHRELVEPLGKE